jgi:hypothetical protein
MLEIRGNVQRLQRFVRKLFSQRLREPAPEFFARDLTRAPFKFSPNEFEPLRLRLAEPFDGQCQPLFGMIGDCQNSSRQIELLRPEVQQWFFARASHFPRHSGKRRHAAAVLPHFDDSGGNKLLQARLQFGCEFHCWIIKDTSIL